MTVTTWTTREGETIPIIDMEDHHLVNTIRMLERSADARIISWIQATPPPRGEMARDAFDAGIDDLAFGADPERAAFAWGNLYLALVEELVRRTDGVIDLTQYDLEELRMWSGQSREATD